MENIKLCISPKTKQVKAFFPDLNNKNIEEVLVKRNVIEISHSEKFTTCSKKPTKRLLNIFFPKNKKFLEKKCWNVVLTENRDLIILTTRQNIVDIINFIFKNFNNKDVFLFCKDKNNYFFKVEEVEKGIEKSLLRRHYIKNVKKVDFVKINSKGNFYKMEINMGA